MGRSRAYETVKLCEGQIRVLKLDPSPFSTAPLSGTLEVQRIDASDHPRLAYEALSYAWESPRTVTGIFIRCPAQDPGGSASKQLQPIAAANLAPPASSAASTISDNASTLRSSVGSVQPASSASSVSAASGGGSSRSELSQSIRDAASWSSVRVRELSVLPLTGNLASALKHLRPRSGPPRRLWIDSVCIDQSNLAEKGAHIPSMGQVYEKASRTLVWLGPASRNSPAVLHFVNQLARRWREDASRAATVEWAVPFLCPIFESVLELLQRSYWSRLWVIQEILKAREHIVLCGYDQAPLDHFRILFELNQELRRREIRPYFVYHCFSEVFTVLERYTEASRAGRDLGMPLFPWVEKTQGFSCTNSRDRLYALLSLCDRATQEWLPVSYDSTQVSNQYLQYKATALFIQKSKNLRPLLSAWRKELGGLPSWAPDWSTTQKGRWNLEGCNACGAFTTPQYCVYRPKGPADQLPLTRCLFVKGWVVDTVACADAFPDIDHLFDQLSPSQNTKQIEHAIIWTFCDRVATWWRTLELLWCRGGNGLDAASPYGTTRAALWSAFWRTVSASAAKNPVISQDLSASEFAALRASIDRFDRAVYQLVMEWFIDAVGYLHQRCFVLTAAGRFGLAPARGAAQTAEGDRVVVLPGAETPVVLHPFDAGPGPLHDDWICDESGTLEGAPPLMLDSDPSETPPRPIEGARQQSLRAPQTWVGGCYVQGMMNGEWITDHGTEDMETFAIL